ncbi:His/Gly/Thr/Pro-type tRNA ligase C-terminal domain-containing protein, partial [Sulfuricurvum sp.]|uniref:His/Gly/Thr/Pro-type tRNA ligase C-terminal domain-containing protein n=1 Tax=Sulfuricurvum sp. TaxID=2025608 RepID=UPI002604237B
LAAEKVRRSTKGVVEYEPRSLKAHLKGADRVNARYCAVIGENELTLNSIWVKDLVEKTESLIPLSDFFA